MAQLYVGTSGWAYPTWKPAFYPEKLAQKKFLNFYASKLNAVEVNYTFRQLVKETTVQNWIAETPEHFRFTIKAHQVLTHIKRLKSAEEFLQRFLGTLEGLERAGRLGPLLFQLPPNFKADQAVLSEFLKCLPRNVRAAFEFRNESWFTDATWSTLRERNIALCVAETEDRTPPTLSLPTTPTIAIASPATAPKSAKRWSPAFKSTSPPAAMSSPTSSTKRRPKVCSTRSTSCKQPTTESEVRGQIAEVETKGSAPTTASLFLPLQSDLLPLTCLFPRIPLVTSRVPPRIPYLSNGLGR